MIQIESLTSKQKALIPIYQEKWQRFALSTEPINRQKALKSVKDVYSVVGLLAPEIIFCDSPYAAFNHLDSHHLNSHRTSLKIDDLCDPIRVEEYYYFDNGTWQDSWDLDTDGSWKLKPDFDQQLTNKLKHKLVGSISNQLRHELYEPLWDDLDFPLWNQLEELGCQYFGTRKLRSFFARYISLYDFYLSVISKDDKPNPWQAYVSLAENCGWIFPAQELCIVCDRPRLISFDDRQILHAEGYPAIQFADGWSVYVYHGVRLPELYGQLPPSQWRSEWILQEVNAALRRVLIQGIGYRRICQELQATELDAWREYTVLTIENVDIEPIYLLKMTCPSTGKIDVLRVPPNIQSAREAICWVNWGIDPDDFSAQT